MFSRYPKYKIREETQKDGTIRYYPMLTRSLLELWEYLHKDTDRVTTSSFKFYVKFKSTALELIETHKKQEAKWKMIIENERVVGIKEYEV